ncbi:uncharacterized protein LOC134272201 [Saccostrea cucullata]|uniref:uncharacterized protein LOC134272201 n=1 Tax=Saccostrea cuccullata TaxID=36930 RepID=UPI002ED61873
MGLLCPDDSVATSKFDVNTMYSILRNHAINIKPPTNGWGRKPDLGKRPADDLERIRFYRNYVLWEKPNAMLMEKIALDYNWKDLSEAIIRLRNGRLEKDIISLRKRSDIYLRVLNNTCSSCPPGIYF